MSTTISPLAYVHPSAEIADGVTIHPFAYIDEGTIIGENCEVMPYASIMRRTTLGRQNTVHQHAVLGSTSQTLRPQGTDTALVIGDHNVFRENTVVSRSIEDGKSTRIGDHNFIMAGAHICHDVDIEDHTVIGLKTVISGWSHIRSHALLSTNCIIFERVDIGEYTLVRGGTRVKRDVPPFITTTTNPATFYSINLRVLQHEGFSEREIRHIGHAYEIVYGGKMDLTDYISRIRSEVPSDPRIEQIIAFLAHTHQRGREII